MTNYEIKILLQNKNVMIEKIKSLGGNFVENLHQVDYYFQVGENKEKLRVINDKEFQLIFYNRVEKGGQKKSEYQIQNLTNLEKNNLLKNKKALREIDKKRELWIYKHTRIHLDVVKNLGIFLELETVVKDISQKEAENEFYEVVKKLEINQKESVVGSYSDLLVVSHKT
jgi:predicted adenylyl cyclase CyaB